MKRRHLALLFVTPAFAACSATRHGPAVATISESAETRYVMTGELDREHVKKTRLRDAQGREWTESKVSGTEPVPGGLNGLEAELFDKANRATASE
jgi:hypothetical protein